MRKITLFIGLLLFVSFSLKAQTVLTYSTHGMNEGDVLVLNKIEAVSPGEAGANQIWDFSQAQILGDVKVNYDLDVKSYIERPAGLAFACIENGNRIPYFQLTSNQRLYYGVANGNTKIEFSEPLVDMQFPFAYGNAIKGNMNGTYTTNNQTTAIEGVYELNADAYGTLILPNGLTLNDVLRVKSVRDYTHEYYGTKYNITTIRYAYYSSASRYPVAQVHNVSYKYGTSGNHESATAYFNPDVTLRFPQQIKANADEMLSFAYSLYPNPVKSDLTLNYTLENTSKVQISIFDLSGKEQKMLLNGKQEKGVYNLTKNLEDVPAGVYVVKLQFGDKVYTEKITKE